MFKLISPVFIGKYHLYPSFKSQSLPIFHNVSKRSGYQIFLTENQRKALLWKPFLFATTSTLVIWTLTSIWEYENSKKKKQRIFIYLDKNQNASNTQNSGYFSILQSVLFPWTWWKSSSDKSSPYAFPQKSDKVSYWESLKSSLPGPVKIFLDEIHHCWQSFSIAEKTIGSLIAINGLVFLAWKVPSLRPWMEKHFLHSLTSPSYTLLTSNFSHMSAFHIGFNMIALWSFGSFIHQQLGQEQFLFLYLSSGIWSSYASHLYKYYSRSLIPSLGASGAICSLLGVTAHFPRIRMSLIILPFVSIPAPYAVLGLVAFDLYGLYSKKFSLDHIGHLAGTAIGYLYFTVGKDIIWDSRHRWLEIIQYPK